MFSRRVPPPGRRAGPCGRTTNRCDIARYAGRSEWWVKWPGSPSFPGEDLEVCFDRLVALFVPSADDDRPPSGRGSGRIPRPCSVSGWRDRSRWSGSRELLVQPLGAGISLLPSRVLPPTTSTRPSGSMDWPEQKIGAGPSARRRGCVDDRRVTSFIESAVLRCSDGGSSCWADARVGAEGSSRTGPCPWDHDGVSRTWGSETAPRPLA